MVNRGVVLLVASAIAIVFGTSAALQGVGGKTGGTMSLAVRESPAPSPVAPVPQTVMPTSSPMAAMTPVPNDSSIPISGCRGVSIAAHFREFPSFSPAVILGAVDIGQSVWLTGRQVQADGETWVQVINPSPLKRAIGVPVQQQRFEANQTGWIAGCFVGR